MTQPRASPETLSLLKDFAYFAWFLLLFEVLCFATKSLDPMKKLHWFLRLNIWVFILMSILALAPEEKVAFIYFAF